MSKVLLGTHWWVLMTRTSQKRGTQVSAICRITILLSLLMSPHAFAEDPTHAGYGRLSRMKMQNSAAVTVGLAHIDAWSHHDWDKTQQLLAPDIHASVNGNEFTGIDDYMARKKKGAQLVEPGSVHVIATFGDESNALIMVTFRIGLGPGGTMVTMARSCLYLLDESKRIKTERDEFFIVTR